MTRIRIPADVDREDRVLAGLTARQLAWLAAGGALVALIWWAGRAILPPVAVALIAVPIVALFAGIAIGRRDGLTADRLAVAALRHHGGARRLAPAPEGVPTMPRWLDSPQPAAMPFPVAGISEDGTLDLGDDGHAVICRASSINFGLRSDDEQEALVAAFGRWLNGLDAPVQVLVRAERADVAAAVGALRDRAGELADPALADAALEHAAFVESLAARRDVLRRTVLVVLRQPAGGVDVLWRRVEEATRALAPAGISVVPLAGDEAVAAIARAVDPDAAPRKLGMALPGETVRRSL